MYCSISFFYYYIIVYHWRALNKTFSLTEEDIGKESVISLHYVKYQNVQNITVSVELISMSQ